MADKKISQLSSASTPVAGTEVLPIVQSSATVKVSIDNLTAGRSVSAASFVPTSATVPTNGIFLGAANSVSVATNSTEHWMVNASGNLNPVGTKGIGTNAAPVSEAVATTFSTSSATAGSNLSGNTLAADGTDTNININITPKGTGEVALPKVNIDGGAIDGTAIGANSASSGTFTSLTSAVDNNIAISGKFVRTKTATVTGGAGAVTFFTIAVGNFAQTGLKLGVLMTLASGTGGTRVYYRESVFRETGAPGLAETNITNITAGNGSLDFSISGTTISVTATSSVSGVGETCEMALEILSRSPGTITTN